jgi:phage minor structural protein
MIYIYESTETVFTHMGLGALSPSSCIITEEVNGDFSLKMTHPIDDEEKWTKLDQQRIIKAPYQGEYQRFRIYNMFKDPITQKYFIVQARHIFYDLMDNFLEDVRPTALDGQDAGDYILDECEGSHGFTFSSDIEGVSTAYYIRKNPVEAFIGPDENSYINRWGGEIARDNFSISINSRVGADNGVKIAYRKNLTGLDITVNDLPVVTRVMPTALDENGVLFTTATKYYDSDYISNYPHPKYGVLNTGIRVGQEVDGSIPYPDEATVLTAMPLLVDAYFDAGADQPQTTLNVSYVDLGKTEEYAAYADLFSVKRGDDVTVYYPPIDIDLKLRVIIMKWDAMLDQPYEAVIGNKEPNIAQTVVDNDIDISAIKTNVEKALLEGEIYYGVGINHENGFVTNATIGGEDITAKFNASQLGWYDSSDNFIGGMALVNSALAMISNILTNDINGNCYATIGNVTIDSNVYQGIFIYRKDYSTSEPIARIVVYSGGEMVVGTKDGGYFTYYADGTITYRDVNDEERLSIADDGHFVIRDADGNERLGLNADGGAVIKDLSRIRIDVGLTETRIYSPNGNNSIYVNDTDAYKNIGGSVSVL